MLLVWKTASSVILSTQLPFYVDSLNIHWRRRTSEQGSHYSQIGSWRTDLDSGPRTCKYLRILFSMEQYHEETWNAHPLIMWCLMFYRLEARPPTGEFPLWWKSNCLGNSLPKHMLLVWYEINQNYEHIWQGANLVNIFLQQVVALVEAMHPSSWGCCVPHMS